MNISVNHIDTTGATHQRNYKMTRLAFAKHLAFAGQGYAPTPQKIFRTIGMFCHYSCYMQRGAFNRDRFSEPPPGLSDPTEKGQFSTLIGKAIADFLSKRLDRSLFTVNYEAAMRLQGHKLTGNRPDLIAYTQNSVFALEAKGRHQRNPGSMTAHKRQAKSGPINVNFSVACVSYNLFQKVTCNYHDPFNDNIPYDNISLAALSRNYYQGLAAFLDESLFKYEEVEIQGERFYEVKLLRSNLAKIFPEEFPFWTHWSFEVFVPRLILPYHIRDYAETGITNETTPFIFDSNEQDRYLYIDNDRVGLQIRR